MPNGHCSYRQFKIQQFYVLPTRCVNVFFYGSFNEQRLFPYTTLTDCYVEIQTLQHRGHYTCRQFNIQQFPVMPTLCLSVLCRSEKKQPLFPYTILTV